MLCLRSTTEDAWLQRAIAHTDAILVDHAHCERKAATQALGLLARYPGRPELVEPMLALAREELEHFEQIVAILQTRGVAMHPQTATGYQAKLFKSVRKDEPDRLMDHLLVASLIEARSCERFKLLSDHHPDETLREVYRGLLASEARHHGTFVRLAEQLTGDRPTVRARLDELAEREVRVLDRSKPLPRLHAGG
jgi:tRNA-(ms[2]io[6]A)-hydroxylase